MTSTPTNLPVINVVSCANEKFSTGLAMSMVSCLAQASGRYNYNMIIVDGGLEDGSKHQLINTLEATAQRVGVSVSHRFVTPEQTLVDKLPHRAGTWMTYARFLLCEMLEENAVVYLDSDILCLRGVEDYYDYWDGSAAIVAARDPMQYLKKDWPDKTTPPPPNAPYFNAGLILMNLNWMRENLSMAHVPQWINTLGQENLHYHDQTIINYVAQGNIIELPRENNWVLATDYAVQVPQKWRELNMHYVGRIKPWLRDTAETRRYFAEVLYQLASKAYGIGHIKPRQIDPKELAKTRRKIAWYSLIKPQRGRSYKQGIESIALADDLANSVTTADFYRNERSQ